MDYTNRMLLKGNEAVVYGALLAGCECFFGYPITPSSEVPEYYAKVMRERPEENITFIQAETEVAAFNMVAGAAATGHRAMTATSGPGFSLGQEAMSYMSAADLPAVVIEIMRAGPADGEILAKYNFLAQAASLQASTEAQLVVSKFIDMYDLDEHVAAIKDCYRKRRDVMMATMEREFPEEAKFTHPNGGLFTWVELPEYINTNEMAKECLKRNVAYVPGDGFFPDAGHNNCIRLNYSCMPEDKIEKGMTILGQVIKEHIKK